MEKGNALSGDPGMLTEEGRQQPKVATSRTTTVHIGLVIPDVKREAKKRIAALQLGWQIRRTQLMRAAQIMEFVCFGSSMWTAWYPVQVGMLQQPP